MDLSTLATLQTEGVNPRTRNIDRISTLQMCKVINVDDHLVADSVEPCLPDIAGAIDALALRVAQGGRVIYVGAGTSGRLGILDASEIPPTFAVPHSQFIGLIAGGDEAIRQAQEGAEDDEKACVEDLKCLFLNPDRDSLIGIASSGRTPYVLGGLAFAKSLGCLTIGVLCTAPSVMSLSGNVDYLIAPLPGSEVVTGSTRLKAGTATKMVLNMLSTGTMIRIGKTYGNMMVDMVASNLKLEQRSRNMLRTLSMKCNGISDSELTTLLTKCNNSVKLAILVAETGNSVQACEQQLVLAGGVLAKALDKRSKLTQSQMPDRQFVLCIDGGGTKCAAVVTDANGTASHGYAGPCNLTDIIANVDAVVVTLLTATRNALREHIQSGTEPSESRWKEYLQATFRSVWVGIAGLDRTNLYEILVPKLGEAFGVDVKLTNDVDLLPAVVSPRDGNSVIVLIAGTGSVVMRYSWTDDLKYIRNARAGGWGHVLGDEGGGFSIGLEAVKHTLAVLENKMHGVKENDLTEFEEAIIKNLGCQVVDDGSIDLLNKILSQSQSRNIKSCIAGIAETVLRFTACNKTANGIVNGQISHLVNKTLSRLANPRCAGYAVPDETDLVLAGGLMKNEGYLQALRHFLRERRLEFRNVHVVDDVALAGAKSLISYRSAKTCL
ncbi:hypothetical protein N7495_001445 [Penicillium taxi]|uniref:uncharacterized protein n=1 Tax=Penicillium taxi TaxID=168475 RepID=UPI0025455F0C|nr:uncharacterized protein N7495_001445 [Penicillium taxi]KAJ5908763.1 hypothetical protein N7495_001445 [Penicillium taxi]